MRPHTAATASSITFIGSGLGTMISATWRPPRRDDGKGDQFPDAPTGVREPRKPGPRSPAGAIALDLPGARG